ncbi:hypothetical protein NUW58_g828 [Xylaria curta]|uniref:Uncharacterized protein n=2 Tax=Xylaria curta TaxID=42375 RepID=A0ACC1PR48_9PEZI|nr:hypothetical protein NUW58_g2117 [Xylaria curta]KAJ2996899.1 hypothetical protein NUW58_g828 [Xylaria curta]
MQYSRVPSLARLFSALFLILGLFSYSAFVTASPIPGDAVEQHNPLEARVDVTDIPSVTSIQAEIKKHGRVGKDASLFYTSLSGGGAIPKITAWYDRNVRRITGRAGVAFDNILPAKYSEDVAKKLMKASLIDKFQKRVSQAFANESTGLVYVFYPKMKEDPVKACDNPGQGLNPPGGFSTWCGQEFPALTRNPKVDAIYQVDPDSKQTSGLVIWKKGDGIKLSIRPEQIN